MTTLEADHTARPYRLGRGTPDEWQHGGYVDDMRNDAVCPREDCGHAGQLHSPDSGCLVEQYAEYCSCPLAPVEDWSSGRIADPAEEDEPGRWPLAYQQRDEDGRRYEDEDDEAATVPA